MSISRMLAVILLLVPVITVANTGPTITLKSLSTKLVHEAVLVAVNECSAKGYIVTAAVTDRGGNLLALLRNPLAGAHTVRTSEQKAYTAASLQVPSRPLEDNPELRFAPGILMIQGGLPISIAGIFYGGIAVSGATPADDEKCAQAGIDAIAEVLEFAD